MKEAILSFFHQYPNVAIMSSVTVSVILAVIGVLPSFFVTAANMLFFGFWEGVAISFAGEAIGAVVAFYLYRKGFKKGADKKIQRFKTIRTLLYADDAKAFWLILALRLIPFVPSGLVTFAAAIGRVSGVVFLLASSIGKLPALLLEAFAVYKVTSFDWQGNLILIVSAAVLLYLVIKRTLVASEKNT